MVDIEEIDGHVGPFVYGTCAVCVAGLPRPNRSRKLRVICPDNPECKRQVSVYAARRAHAVIRRRPARDTRTCSVCGETKPLDGEHFYPRSKTKGLWDYWCKTCRLEKSRQSHARHRERRNEAHRVAHRNRVENETPEQRAERLERIRLSSERYRRRHPERFARLQAESHQRAMEDPVRRARFFESRRIRYRLKAASEGREVAARSPVSSGRGRRVPVAPIALAVAEWANRRLTCSFTADGMPGADLESLIAGLGTSARTVRRWQSGESPTANFDVADAVVTGMECLWFDVYDPQRWAARMVFSPTQRLDVLAWIDAVWLAQQAWEGDD